MGGSCKGNLKAMHHLEDLGLNGENSIKVDLRIRTSGGPLWTLECHKVRWIP